MIASRLARLRAYMESQQLDAIMASKEANVRYFSGFTGDSAVLVITGNRALLITDFRYLEQAALEAPLFEISRQENGLLKQVATCLNELGSQHIGFEGGSLTYDKYTSLQKSLAGVSLEKSVSLDELRQIKDAEELDAIKQAVAIADEAFDDIVTFLRPGISELQVAARLEQTMRALGSERPAFATIVASGTRGSLPHGIATEKLLAAGEFVTMDYGAVYHGYHSDMTRTVCLGRADARQRDVYNAVLGAQLLGVSQVQAGSSGKEVDKAARDFLAAAGFGDNFGHGLGHSLGLEIHEEPRLSPLSTCESLIPGMIVTVEPGVYLPGWGGVRIEDTVLVTAEGGRPLTASDKKLIEIV